MQNAIVEKLRQHLTEPVDTECKVVYLLCELRKLFPTTVPLSLYMHANWALHVTLDRNPGAQEFLKKSDIFIEEYLRHGTVPLPAPSLFKDFLFTGSFRKDLREFLNSFGLPIDLCNENNLWFQFVAAYAGVIEDGVLICRGNGLKVIKEISFSKGRPLSNTDLPFEIDWRITLVDGRRLLASFSSDATNSIEHVWGFKFENIIP